MNETNYQQDYANDPIQPAQSGGTIIESSDEFKYKMLEVAISQGSAAMIDQIFFNEMAIANLKDEDATYVEGLLKAAKMYLLASKTNRKSKRTYNLTSNILSCYQRARTVCILTKGREGWGMQQVMTPKTVQKIEHSQKFADYSEKDKKKLFGKRSNELEP